MATETPWFGPRLCQGQKVRYCDYLAGSIKRIACLHTSLFMLSRLVFFLSKIQV